MRRISSFCVSGESLFVGILAISRPWQRGARRNRHFSEIDTDVAEPSRDASSHSYRVAAALITRPTGALSASRNLNRRSDVAGDAAKR